MGTLVILTADGSKVWRSKQVSDSEALDAARQARVSHPNLPIGLFEHSDGVGGEMWCNFSDNDW